jgi:hypothetical protein
MYSAVEYLEMVGRDFARELYPRLYNKLGNWRPLDQLDGIRPSRLRPLVSAGGWQASVSNIANLRPDYSYEPEALAKEDAARRGVHRR